MRVFIADNQPLFAQALADLLKLRSPPLQVTIVSSLTALQDAFQRSGMPSLLIYDLSMPSANGFSGLMHWCTHYPELRVLALSVSDEPELAHRALMHGAMAYMPKSAVAEDLLCAVNHVLAGECWLPQGLPAEPLFCAPDTHTSLARRLSELSPRRFRILMMLADGLLNKQIAWELGLAEATIKAHVSAIMKLLRVRNRTQIVIAAAQLRCDPSLRIRELKSADLPNWRQAAALQYAS